MAEPAYPPQPLRIHLSQPPRERVPVVVSCHAERDRVVDVFRDAISSSASPSSIAVSTMQEAIRPQKQTTLVQDENQLLENGLRTLLQELVGSEVRVIGVGEPASPSSSCRLPHIPVDEKITPNAKIKSNALYIVEVASRGGSIVKKLAQLERDAHYALLRAKSTDVRDIIGFVAVSMMEKESFQVATIIIQSHPQIFKLLYALVQARALAYFFNERTMYKDVSNLMHSMNTVVSKLGRLEGRLETMVSKLGRLETMVLIGFVAIGCLLLRNKH